MNFFEERMRNCGIPCIDVSNFKFTHKTSKRDEFANFLLGKGNLVIVGNEQYKYAVKIARLCLTIDMNKDIQFLSCSSFIDSDITHSMYASTLLIIHSIREVEEGFIKQKCCSKLDALMVGNRQILLTAESTSCIKSLFQFSMESIDKNFELIKV